MIVFWIRRLKSAVAVLRVDRMLPSGLPHQQGHVYGSKRGGARAGPGAPQLLSILHVEPAHFSARILRLLPGLVIDRLQLLFRCRRDGMSALDSVLDEAGFPCAWGLPCDA